MFKNKHEKNEKDREAKISDALNDMNSKNKNFFDKKPG